MGSHALGTAADRIGRRRRRAAVVGALAVVATVAAACNSSGSGSGGGNTGTTTKVSFNTLITEGQAAQNAGDSTQAETYYNEALAMQPNNAIALYDLADLEQVSLGNDTAAEANYKKAIATNPNFENALFNLAILVTPSNPTEAEGYYNRVLAIDPKNAAAHLNLGYVLITLGKKAAGDAQIRKAATLDPAYDNRLPATSGASGTS